MSAIKGYTAEAYGQVIAGVSNTAPFSVGDFTVSERGKLPFTGLTDGDTITYKAVSKDDPSKREIGTATYVGATQSLTRADVNVVASSNSNNRVDFRKPDGSHGMVVVEGFAIATIA